jgi:hypothetical protein
VDCEHPIVDLESRPVTALDTITYAHWFKCQFCRVKAVVVEHVAIP